MKFIKSKKSVALLAALAVAVVAAVGAYAYFTSTGTGSGSATVGTSTAWAVTSDPASGDALTPGSGLSQSVAYHVKNNNAGQQKLQTVTIQVAKADGSAWTSGTCSKDDFKVGGALAGATAVQNPSVNLASTTQYDGSVTVEMVDTGLNQNDCKGVSVPLYFSAS